MHLHSSLRTSAAALALFGGAVVVLSLAGCQGDVTKEPTGSDSAAEHRGNSEEEQAIKGALSELSPEERVLAESQKFCPIMADSRLGSMGAPFKVVIKDQSVFLCCKGCQKKALADPDKTLAKVEQLKAKTKAGAAKS